MTDDIFKIVGIIIIIGFLIFLAAKAMKLHLNILEGMANPLDSSSSSVSGVAGTSTDYANTIKAAVIKMQDTLLIDTYRKDYENAIVYMDDYNNLLMLQAVLNMKISGSTNVEAVKELNEMNSFKTSLNIVMHNLDKYKKI